QSVPISYPSTPPPSSAIVPLTSWPSTTPTRTPLLFSPRMIRRSVPQTVFDSTLSRISPGPGVGSGSSVSSARPGPENVKPRIASPCARIPPCSDPPVLGTLRSDRAVDDLEQVLRGRDRIV